jgi:transcriptional regulator with XRE-family HTH domain
MADAFPLSGKRWAAGSSPVLGLRLARYFRNLTQTDLSFRTGIPQRQLSNIETGRLNPTPGELRALARALGIDDPSVLIREFADPTSLPGGDHA